MAFGRTFQPGAAGESGNGGQGRELPETPIQQAIKLISLRFPRVVGGGAPAPTMLLRGPGAGGSPLAESAVLQTQAAARRLLGAVLGQMPPSIQSPQGGFAPPPTVTPSPSMPPPSSGGPSGGGPFGAPPPMQPPVRHMGPPQTPTFGPPRPRPAPPSIPTFRPPTPRIDFPVAPIPTGAPPLPEDVGREWGPGPDQSPQPDQEAFPAGREWLRDKPDRFDWINDLILQAMRGR